MAKPKIYQVQDLQNSLNVANLAYDQANNAYSQANLSGNLVAVYANNSLVYANANVNFNNSATINVSVVANTTNKRANIEFTANGSAITFLPNGSSRVATTIQSKLREVDSIFDFMTETQINNVRSNTAFDCSAIAQTAISTLQSEKKSSLYFPPGTYYFSNTVNIDFSNQDAFRIYGASQANYFTYDTGGTIFTGTANVDSIFTMITSNLSVAKGYAFECDHIFFKSRKITTGTGPSTALKNKVGGAPARPFIVKNCGFVGFDKAIVSDLSTASPLTTGICQTILRENSFVACDYALYGTGSSGSVMDLVFCDSVSENGGKIYISNLLGTFYIADNLLEGQADSIVIDGAKFHGEITRNYFEQNTGDLINIAATNPVSEVVIGPHYVFNCSGAKVYVKNCQFDIQEKNFNDAGVLVDVPFGYGKNRIANAGTIYPRNWSQGANYRLDLTSISTKTTIAPGSITSGQWVTQGGTAQDTPIGNLDVVNVNGNGAWMNPTITLSANDAIVAMAIARRANSNPNLYLAVYDQAFTYLTNSETSQPVGSTAARGEWVFVMTICRVPASSNGNLQARWVTSGTGDIDMSETYFYKVSTPANNSTAAYYFMPNP